MKLKPYNASDEKHVKGRKEQDRQEENRDLDAIQYVMGDVRGRNFVWSLLDQVGIYQDSFTGNSHTFYNEGRRSVGLRLIKSLEALAPVKFIQMWQEHLVKEEKAEKSDEAIRTESVDQEDF